MTRTKLHAEIDTLIAAYLEYLQLTDQLFPPNFPSVKFPNVFRFMDAIKAMDD